MGFKIKVKTPATRKPVQRKPNTVMKSKKDYKRNPKHKKKEQEE